MQGTVPMIGELVAMLLYNGSDGASISAFSILQAVSPHILLSLPSCARQGAIVARGAEDANKHLDPLLVEQVLLNFKQERVPFQEITPLAFVKGLFVQEW